MEALAIFGGITAGVTLSAEIIRLSRSLREMIKSIKYARDDINKVAEEMFIFAEQLTQFLRTCSDSPASTPFVSFSPESLVSWTKGATRGLKRLLREVKALTSDVRYDYSIVERVTAHVKWYFSKGSMKRFRASLRVARESMNGFTNIRVIEKLNEQLIFLKQAIREGNRKKIEAELGMTVEKSIENLELAIQNHRHIHREIGTRLQKAKETVIVQQEKSEIHEFVPKANKLFDFTESVAQYAEDVLPPTGSASGTRKLYQSNEFKHELMGARSKKKPSSKITTSTVSTPMDTNLLSPRHFATGLTVLDASSTGSDIVNGPQSIFTRRCRFNKSNCSICFNEPSSTIWSSNPSLSSASTPSIGATPIKEATRTSTDKNARRNNTYRSGPAKEYVNDPEGSILSPPRVKSRSSSTNPKIIATRGKNDDDAMRDAEIEPAEAQIAPESTVVRARDTEQLNDQTEESHVTNASGNESGNESNYESEMESEAQVDEEDIDKGPSPFKPVAGFQGRFPRRWHQRHERDESPLGL